MKLLLVMVPALFLIFLMPLSAEAKSYENEKYTFEYPNGCKLEKKENRFSTANAVLDCKGDAGLQFESSTEVSETLAGSSDDDLVENMQSVFESNYDNTDIIETGTDKYTINNQTAPYIIGTYDQEFYGLFGTRTEPWALMTIIMKLGNGEHVLLQYRNNEDSFDKQLPMVEKIFQSVKGVGIGTETGTDTDNSVTSQDDFSKTRELCDTVTTQSAKDLCETLLN
jgi:hypothetical protein